VILADEIVVKPENPENHGVANGSAVELTKPEELAVSEVLAGERSVFLSVAVF
jgi:hypothetical protein